MNEREEVARIIYPEAFTEETPHRNTVYRNMGYHEARADALAKADRILSLRQPPAGGRGAEEAELIEKMARAICDRFARQRYPRMMDGSRAGYVDENWRKWVEHARAALAAIRQAQAEAAADMRERAAKVADRFERPALAAAIRGLPEEGER